MNHPDLTVILVNWNALALTSTALASLREHTQGITYEVFVVDNGTTQDASVRELPAKFSWITFLVNPTNQGFTVANNRAIRLAKGRYVLLLNNDTVQTENALGKSVEYMDTHLEVGALGIKHLNNDAIFSPQPSHSFFPRVWDETLALVGFQGKAVSVAPAAPPEGADVDWVCGSFLLIRRACLEQVGELDERFFTYDEDVDWCFRAHRLGWKVRFWAGTSMIHLGSGAMPSIKDKTFMIFRSHLTYIRKNHGVLAAIAYYSAMGLRLITATVWQAVRWLLGRGKREELRERFARQVQFLSLRPSRFGVQD